MWKNTGGGADAPAVASVLDAAGAGEGAESSDCWPTEKTEVAEVTDGGVASSLGISGHH